MATLGEVNPNLVRTSCFKSALDERVRVAKMLDWRDVRDSAFAVFCPRGASLAVTSVSH